MTENYQKCLNAPTARKLRVGENTEKKNTAQPMHIIDKDKAHKLEIF